MSEDAFTRSIAIDASPAKVWSALTDPALMPRWMSETEMTVETDWKIGGSIFIQGRWHKMRYKNVGVVLLFDPGRALSYSHLSSLSRMPDLPENHAVLTFRLATQEQQTIVELEISHSPTFEIRKHLEFYWNITMGILKQFVEQELRENA